MPPAISVVMPTFDSQHHIRRAVCSILNQSMEDWELVVVDDGCRDQTIQRIKEIQRDCGVPDKIRILHQPHQGCAAATHLGIKESQAPVVTVVDSDDMIHPYSLACITYLMYLHRHVGYLWSKFECGSAPDMLSQCGWSKDLPRGMSMLQAFCKTAWWGGQHQRAVRRDVYLSSGGLDTAILYAVDLQLATVMASTECGTLFFNHTLYWYRVHRSHITGQHRQQQRMDHTRIIQGLRRGYSGKSGGSHLVVQPGDCDDVALLLSPSLSAVRA